MSQNLDKLTKKQLLEYIEKLQAEVETAPPAKESTPEPAPVPTGRDVEVEQLRAALAGLSRKNAALRTRAESAAGEAQFAVVNVGGSGVAIYARNERGHRERFYFARRDEVHYLTAAQIAEVRQAQEWLFTDGLLHVPELAEESDNPNIISDYEEFVAGVTLESLADRIEAMTSLHTLQAIGQYVESERYQVVVEGDEEVLKEVPLSPKLTAIGNAVANRIEALEDQRKRSAR
jgi:hypothetical protein